MQKHVQANIDVFSRKALGEQITLYRKALKMK